MKMEHVCRKCKGKSPPSFATRWELQRHIHEAHALASGGCETIRSRNVDNNTKRYPCKFCDRGERFHHVWELLRHQHVDHPNNASGRSKGRKKGHHANGTDVGSTCAAQKQPPDSAAPKSPLKCSICSVAVSSRNQLFKHLKEIHEDGGDSHSETGTSRPGGGGSAACDNRVRNCTGFVEAADPVFLQALTPLELCDMVKVVKEDEWYMIVHKPQGLATVGTTDDEPSLFRHSNVLFLSRGSRKGFQSLRTSATAQSKIDDGTDGRPDDSSFDPSADGASSRANPCSNNVHQKTHLRFKKARPCHRLDKATGGLVVCSKGKRAQRLLSACFLHRLATKRYVAMVAGRLEPPTGDIKSPISGRDAHTRYAVKSYTRSGQYGWVTTVDLWPVSGRRHQLRKHLASVGHAILGDRKYAHAADWPSWGPAATVHAMFLNAVELCMPHPRAAEGGLLDQMGVELQPMRQKKTKVVQPLYATDNARCGDCAVECKRKKTKGGGDSGHNMPFSGRVCPPPTEQLSANTSLLTEQPSCDVATDTNNGVYGTAHVLDLSKRQESAPLDQDFITASIAEPAYYTAFRCAEESNWRAMQAGSTSHSTVNFSGAHESTSAK